MTKSNLERRSFFLADLHKYDLTRFGMVTHIGEWRVARSQPCLIPWGGLPILLCPGLFPQRLTWNDQIQHGNTMGRGVFLGLSHTLILGGRLKVLSSF